jgi:hypothetical protein
MQVLQVLSVAAHALAFLALRSVPEFAAVAPLGVLAVPAAVSMNMFAAKHHLVPREIKPLKIYATKWHMAFSAALFLVYITSGVSVHGAESLA